MVFTVIQYLPLIEEETPDPLPTPGGARNNVEVQQ
jgi:hypothetical protein